MAEDTEKKFHSIMDKLFSSPRSNRSLSSSTSSPSNIQNTRGQKRPYSAMELTSKGDKNDGIPDVVKAPPCRPWDRGDLMRRLATFKSMTWFAKPKVMDAVNCARRGWVNIDMDIISCEICGARLQFSTPASWSREQIEKAALVFSLKLNSAHKLLCSWIDNACDENLVLFPPMPTSVLADQYKERSSSLLQLSALPVISASALVGMSQLELFLKQSIASECGEGANGSSGTENLGDDVEDASADLYHQAHKILSLCGWEPRLLPYTVDCSHQSEQSVNGADISSTSPMAAGDSSNKLSVYVSCSSDSTKANEDSSASGVYYDPNSTILECKLCGASAGLWAFRTVPRPLELIRLAGYAEIDGGDKQKRKNSETGNQANNGKTDSNTSMESNLSLTIAGGPSPAKQNFRARISLPVVGRNVRTRFSSELSQQRNTSEDGSASHNSIEENSMQKIQSVDGSVGGAEMSDTVSQDNIGVSEPSSVTVDESSNLWQKPTDETPLSKETPSVAIGGQEENGGGNLAKQKDVSTASMDLRRPFSDKKMEFHPIRQHRHFCPWVTSTGATAPGWQQTLSALQKEKVLVVPESKDSPSSPSLIKVDDPITSIRKLFESPPAKRAKPTST